MKFLIIIAAFVFILTAAIVSEYDPEGLRNEYRFKHSYEYSENGICRDAIISTTIWLNGDTVRFDTKTARKNEWQTRRLLVEFCENFEF